MNNRIEKSIELSAPIERVWRALTDSSEFGAWFRVTVDRPFVPGYVVRGHITFPGYEHLTWEAEIVAMEANHLFSFRWHPYAIDPAVDYSGEPSTLVEFRLTSLANGTSLMVAEIGFDALPSHRQAEAFRMNESGWQHQLCNIERYLAA